MSSELRISRRKFLKALGAGLTSGAVSAGAIPEIFAAEDVEHHAILYNGLNCVGCQLCQLGCKTRNDLPSFFETKLSPYTYLYVSAGAAEGKYVKMRYSCNHCHDAPCKEACPVSAIKRSKQGLVYIDQKRCVGCEYCVIACPYSVPKYDHYNGVSSKCTGCYDLVEKGEKPACVQSCPWNALSFDKRDKIVAMAQDIAAKNPGAHVYGLDERKGLNVIYILPVEAAKAGLVPEVSTFKSIYPSNYLYEPFLLGAAPIIGVVAGYYLKKKEG